MNNNLRIAFTLIELLVVIAIVGILSGLIIVGMNNSIQSATIAKAQIFSASLRDSLLMSLVSEWHLDGNANDSWSGGNNGTIVGAVATSSNNCILGSCLLFDGDNANYVSIPHNDNLEIGSSNYTYSLWFKASNDDCGDIINRREGVDATVNLVTLYRTSRIVYFSVRNNGTSVQAVNSSTTTSANQWHNAVFGRNGSSMLMYINGQNVSQGILVAGNAPDFTGISKIAGTDGYYCGSFAGYVDEFRFFNAAIPASRIRNQYYTGLQRLLSKNEISIIDYNQELGKI